jgi:hypothetical protein
MRLLAFVDERPAKAPERRESSDEQIEGSLKVS